MSEKRFYYNILYYPNTEKIMEYEIIDRKSYPNYPNINEEKDLPNWYVYIGENDSHWQDMIVDLLNELDTKCNQLSDENEQLKQLLKEAEEEILILKESKEQLLESIVEKDSEN